MLLILRSCFQTSCPSYLRQADHGQLKAKFAELVDKQNRLSKLDSDMGHNRPEQTINNIIITNWFAEQTR